MAFRAFMKISEVTSSAAVCSSLLNTRTCRSAESAGRRAPRIDGDPALRARRARALRRGAGRSLALQPAPVQTGRRSNWLQGIGGRKRQRWRHLAVDYRLARRSTSEAFGIPQHLVGIFRRRTTSARAWVAGIIALSPVFIGSRRLY